MKVATVMFTLLSVSLGVSLLNGGEQRVADKTPDTYSVRTTPATTVLESFSSTTRSSLLRTRALESRARKLGKSSKSSKSSSSSSDEDPTDAPASAPTESPVARGGDDDSDAPEPTASPDASSSTATTEDETSTENDASEQVTGTEDQTTSTTEDESTTSTAEDATFEEVDATNGPTQSTTTSVMMETTFDDDPPYEGPCLEWPDSRPIGCECNEEVEGGGDPVGNNALCESGNCQLDIAEFFCVE